MIKEVHIINDDIVYEDLDNLINTNSSILTKLDKEWLSSLYVQEVIRRKLYAQEKKEDKINMRYSVLVKANYYTDITLIHDFDNLIRWVEHIKKFSDAEYKKLYRMNFDQAIKHARRFNKALALSI